LRDAGIIQPFDSAGRSLLKGVLSALLAQARNCPAIVSVLPLLHLRYSWLCNRKKTIGRAAGRIIMAAYILVASF